MLKHIPKAFFSTLTGAKRLPERSFMEEVMCNTLRGLIASGQGKGIDHMREQMEGLSAYSPGLKQVVSSNVEMAGVNCLLVQPKGDHDDSRVILYLHGGGYISGTPQSYKALIADIAVSANCMVIAPDYGLAPEAAFPQPQDDCLAVARACIAEHSGKRLIIAGDSAGGALAIATTLSILEGAAANTEPVQSLVLISPWVDPLAEGGSIDRNADHDFLLGPFLEKSFQALMQGQSSADPRVNFTKADLTKLPRTLVQFGTGELFHDQIHQFNQRAIRQGVDLEAQAYADQCHDFQFFTAVSATARLAVSRIGEFVRT